MRPRRLAPLGTVDHNGRPHLRGRRATWLPALVSAVAVGVMCAAAWAEPYLVKKKTRVQIRKGSGEFKGYGGLFGAKKLAAGAVVEVTRERSAGHIRLKSVPPAAGDWQAEVATKPLYIASDAVRPAADAWLPGTVRAVKSGSLTALYYDSSINQGRPTLFNATPCYTLGYEQRFKEGLAVLVTVKRQDIDNKMKGAWVLKDYLLSLDQAELSKVMEGIESVVKVLADLGVAVPAHLEEGYRRLSHLRDRPSEAAASQGLAPAKSLLVGYRAYSVRQQAFYGELVQELATQIARAKRTRSGAEAGGEVLAKAEELLETARPTKIDIAKLRRGGYRKVTIPELDRVMRALKSGGQGAPVAPPSTLVADKRRLESLIEQAKGLELTHELTRDLRRARATLARAQGPQDVRAVRDACAGVERVLEQGRLALLTRERQRLDALIGRAKAKPLTGPDGTDLREAERVLASARQPGDVGRLKRAIETMEDIVKRPNTPETPQPQPSPATQPRRTEPAPKPTPAPSTPATTKPPAATTPAGTQLASKPTTPPSRPITTRPPAATKPARTQPAPKPAPAAPAPAATKPPGTTQPRHKPPDPQPASAQAAVPDSDTGPVATAIRDAERFKRMIRLRGWRCPPGVKCLGRAYQQRQDGNTVWARLNANEAKRCFEITSLQMPMVTRFRVKLKIELTRGYRVFRELDSARKPREAAIETELSEIDGWLSGAEQRTVKAIEATSNMTEVAVAYQAHMDELIRKIERVGALVQRMETEPQAATTPQPVPKAKAPDAP